MFGIARVCLDQLSTNLYFTIAQDKIVIASNYQPFYANGWKEH